MFRFETTNYNIRNLQQNLIEFFQDIFFQSMMWLVIKHIKKRWKERSWECYTLESISVYVIMYIIYHDSVHHNTIIGFMMGNIIIFILNFEYYLINYIFREKNVPII